MKDFLGTILINRIRFFKGKTDLFKVGGVWSSSSLDLITGFYQKSTSFCCNSNALNFTETLVTVKNIIWFP